MATDIVFLFDVSGSMSYNINNVKNNVSNFVDYLKSGGVSDYRLGFVTFEGENYISTYNFTTNVEEFKSAVDAITTYGGEEYGLTALQAAMNMDLRENAVKEFIVVTDEGYEENDYYSDSTLTATNIQTALNNANIKVDVFGEMGSYSSSYYQSCQDDWEPLANSTNWAGTNITGKFYDINTDFSVLFQNISSEITQVDPTGNSDGGFTHRMSLAHWSYGFTPSFAATSTSALISGSSSDILTATDSAASLVTEALPAAAISTDTTTASLTGATSSADTGIVVAADSSASGTSLA